MQPFQEVWLFFLRLAIFADCVLYLATLLRKYLFEYESSGAHTYESSGAHTYESSGAHTYGAHLQAEKYISIFKAFLWFYLDCTIWKTSRHVLFHRVCAAPLVHPEHTPLFVISFRRFRAFLLNNSFLCFGLV